MELVSLYLHDFRNYEKAFVTFKPGINVIHGNNAQGKTNLLEAIYLLTTGKSFRTLHLADLIRFGASSFYVEGHFLKNGVEEVLKISFDGKNRTVIHNDTTLSKLSDLFGLLLSVIITPSDSQLLHGTPSFRRRFLDLHIAQSLPAYLNLLSRYLKALKYRNDLLKNQTVKAIEVWEEEMATSGSFIMKARQKAILELNHVSRKIQDELSGTHEELALEYKPSVSLVIDDLKKHLVELYHHMRGKELERGQTLYGPHKDDLSISLQGKGAKLFASEGQKRSTIASLRMSEWARLKEISHEIPLICVDDVDINLDPSRVAHFYNHLTTMGQVFLTTPQEISLPFDAHLIPIGEVKQARESTLR